MHGSDTKKKVAHDEQVQAETAIQKERVQENYTEPNQAEGETNVDANQISGSEQHAGTEAHQKLPLAGQEEGDREEVREDQKRDVCLEILAVDRYHEQSLGEGKPDWSVQSPEQKESKEARSGGNGIKVSSHQEQIGAE